jgi:hypothetical protein
MRRSKAYPLAIAFATILVVAYFVSPWLRELVAQAPDRYEIRSWKNLVFLAVLGILLLTVGSLWIASRIVRRRRGLASKEFSHDAR